MACVDRPTKQLKKFPDKSWESKPKGVGKSRCRIALLPLYNSMLQWKIHNKIPLRSSWTSKNLPFVRLNRILQRQNGNGITATAMYGARIAYIFIESNKLGMIYAFSVGCLHYCIIIAFLKSYILEWTAA